MEDVDGNRKAENLIVVVLIWATYFQIWQHFLVSYLVEA